MSKTDKNKSTIPYRQAGKHVVGKIHTAKNVAKKVARKELRTISLGDAFAVFSVGMLLMTTIVWSVLGAKIHLSNSDQLVNTYLFENWDTFRNASFPAAHSFLIKWPLFYIVKLLGPSSLALGAVTVATAVSTVGALAYIIYRIERRSYLFGIIILALASALLLVPSQPYAGGILPVNMAMLATRNLEYIVYIICLLLLIKSPSFKSVGFWLAVLLFAVLGASDKLFLTISLAGAVFSTVAYAALNRWRMARLSAKWLAFSTMAIVVSLGILKFINAHEITNIGGQIGGSPYGLSLDPKSLALGIIFGGLGLLTNFGANPAFDALVLRDIPKLAGSQLTSAAGLTYIINFAIVLAGAFVVLKLLVASLKRGQSKILDNPIKLSLLLIWSSVAAAGAFIATDHYFVVDARYLSLILFAFFISIATLVRKVNIKSQRLYLAAGTIMTFGIMIGYASVAKTYNSEVSVLSDINIRNNLIVQSLNNHPVDALVGDYWRVLPMKQSVNKNLQITPLDDCTTPREALSSKSWLADTHNRSFAYLLSFDKSLTNFPKCSVEKVISHYGNPNQTILIAGKIDDPKELLLFYDLGAFKSAPAQLVEGQMVNTVLPITLEQINRPTCTKENTTMNIVAHEDDDLLFMNPSVMQDINSGRCITTVYITAGDAGIRGEPYWQARERGSEAAYSSMLGTDNIWVHRTVKLGNEQFVEVVSPKGSLQVTLIFLRLPDGNLFGQGYKASNFESLENLELGGIKSLHAADKQSKYSAQELVEAIGKLINTFKPSKINTQAPQNTSLRSPDHSDHLATGRFAERAFELYQDREGVLFEQYLAYPVRDFPQNVFGDELAGKTKAFLEYAKFDGAVCHTIEECNESSAYGSYLKRKYIFTR